MITRTPVAPSVTRRSAGPPADGVTIHAIGDTHIGPVFSNEAWRLDTVSRDATRERMPTPSAVVQLGDGINDQPSVQTAMFKQFMGRFKAPWYAVMGNHDITNDVQTPAQWAAGLGYPSPSHIIDLPSLRLVFFSPSEQYTNYHLASPAALSWLDTACTTSKPVFVFCHFSLFETNWGSETAPFFLGTTASPGNSSGVLAVLAAHTNVKAWISGHTHQPVDYPSPVMSVKAGTTKLAAINASCIWYTQAPPSPYPLSGIDGMFTGYVTWLGDRIEVRYRDHGAGQWGSPNGRGVFTVDGLT